jgi:hypothetical protein
MKPKHPWRWIIGSLVAIVLCIGTLLFCNIIQFCRQTKSEYETIRVVQMVEDYVKTHNGKWPSSWEDLDGTATAKRLAPLDSRYFRQYATVNFALTAEQLITNPDLIYDAVMPLSRKYTVYPHARMDLDEVMQAIRDAQPPPPTRGGR